MNICKYKSITSDMQIMGLPLDKRFMKVVGTFNKNNFENFFQYNSSV